MLGLKRSFGKSLFATIIISILFGWVTLAQAQVSNGDFETGNLTGWTIFQSGIMPTVTSTDQHSGTYSIFLGSLSGINAQSGVYQEIVVPSSCPATLSFWYRTVSSDFCCDRQECIITNTSGVTLTTVFSDFYFNSAWQQSLVDLSAYAGQTVRVVFNVNLDSVYGTGMYVDDVVISNCIPTPTPTAVLSTLGKPVLAPVPATRGTKVCMFYTKAPTSSEMEIYNANGEKLSKVSTEDANNHCWDTKNAAPGVYFVKINVVYADGKKETIWRKAVVIP